MHNSTKIAPLNFIVDGKSRKDEISSLVVLMEDKVGLDEEIFARGFFVPDPKFLNYGLDYKGKVKLLDLGGVVANPFCDEEYLKRLLIRGSGHYFNYLGLQVMFSKESLIPTSQGRKLATKYHELVNLALDDKVDARTFFRFGPYLHNLVPRFGSSFVKIALEEISKLPEVKIPDNTVINAALAATPQKWIIYQNGNIGLLS